MEQHVQLLKDNEVEVRTARSQIPGGSVFLRTTFEELIIGKGFSKHLNKEVTVPLSARFILGLILTRPGHSSLSDQETCSFSGQNPDG